MVAVVSNPVQLKRMIFSMGRSRVRMTVSMTPDDRTLIESAAKAAGISASAWMVQAAREQARWTVAQRIGDEIAAEMGVTDEDLAWAESVLRGETDG